MTLNSFCAGFNQFKRENANGAFSGTITCSIGNETNAKYDALISVAIKNDDGSYTSIVSQPQQIELEKQQSRVLRFNVDYAFPLGDYKLYTIESTDNGKTWVSCYGNEVNGKTVKVIEQYIMQNHESANTGSVVIDGLQYDLSPETFTAQLVANNYMGDIIIPEQVSYRGQDYIVTAIGAHCFDRCTALTSVHMPETLLSIGNSGFSDCAALTEIEIPQNVTSLGSATFIFCI